MQESKSSVEMQQKINDFEKGHLERMAELKNLSLGDSRIEEILDKEFEAIKAMSNAPFEIALKNLSRIEQKLSTSNNGNKQISVVPVSDTDLNTDSDEEKSIKLSF